MMSKDLLVEGDLIVVPEDYLPRYDRGGGIRGFFTVADAGYTIGIGLRNKVGKVIQANRSNSFDIYVKFDNRTHWWFSYDEVYPLNRQYEVKE